MRKTSLRSLLLAAALFVACAGIGFGATQLIMRSLSNQTRIGMDAALIHGNCAVINWDASEETWDKAKAEWLRLKSQGK